MDYKLLVYFPPTSPHHRVRSAFHVLCVSAVIALCWYSSFLASSTGKIAVVFTLVIVVVVVATLPLSLGHPPQAIQPEGNRTSS